MTLSSHQMSVVYRGLKGNEIAKGFLGRLDIFVFSFNLLTSILQLHLSCCYLIVLTSSMCLYGHYSIGRQQNCNG